MRPTATAPRALAVAESNIHKWRTSELREFFETPHWEFFNQRLEAVGKHGEYRGLVGSARIGMDDVADVDETRRAVVDLVNRFGLSRASLAVESHITAEWTVEVELAGPKTIRTSFSDVVLGGFALELCGLPETGERSNWLWDIGAGYGGLAVAVARLRPSAQIVLIDLPPAGLIQCRHIEREFGQGACTVISIDRDDDLTVANNQELMSTRFLVVPPNRVDILRRLPRPAHVAATRSLQEMRLSAVNYYIDLIQTRLQPGGYFFVVNRIIKVGDGFVSRLRSFDFDSRWDLVSRSSIGKGKILGVVLRRRSSPNRQFRSTFRRMIPRTDFDYYRDRKKAVMQVLMANLPPRLLVRLQRLGYLGDRIYSNRR